MTFWRKQTLDTRHIVRVAALTSLSLIAFAGNSLLCRAALAAYSLDPLYFTVLRLVSAALALSGIIWLNNRRVNRGARGEGAHSEAQGLGLRRFKMFSMGPLVLIAYSLTFSYAYTALDTGTGALVLFGAVQLTLVAVSIIQGIKPRVVEWLGMALSFGGLYLLVYSNLQAATLVGFVLMGISGIAWGLYTHSGRSSSRPLVDSQENFIAALPLLLVSALALWLLGALANAPAVSLAGVVTAVACGALTTGVGYALWFSVVKHLSPALSGIAQLNVPLLAAFGGSLFLGEAIHLKTVIAAVLILGGVFVATCLPKRAKV